MRRMASYLAAMATVVAVLSGCSYLKWQEESPRSTRENMSEESPPEISEEQTPDSSAFTPSEEPGTATQESKREYERTVVIATDIHYLAKELTDYGPEFDHMVEHGDGRVVAYIDQITDAFIEETVNLNPDAVILSGDLSFNGGLLSHQEFSDKLYRIKEAGIPVLVIPGNHDLNNPDASVYDGAAKYPADQTSPEDFQRIYQDFGYGGAISRDPHSLSYVYQLDEDTRFLMIDSCQYDDVAKVGGALMTETYDWIDSELEDAWNQDIYTIPVSHHNLLDQSEVYTVDCTIEHSEELTELLESWEIPLHLSGHLHVQHMKRHGKDGIYEIVTSSMTTPNCQYGILKFYGDDGFEYDTRQLDMERWAEKHESEEEDLLDFNSYKTSFLKRVFYNQAYDILVDEGIADEELKLMCNFYATLNFYYYQGIAVEVKDELLQDKGYQMWLEKGVSSHLNDYVEYILRDAVADYNSIRAVKR